MTRSSAPSPVRTGTFEAKTSFDSSHSERGRTRTRDSTQTTCSDVTIPTISEPTRKQPASPTMNVYTTCGRHTDQFLFSGPSLGDMARSLLNRSRSRRRKEEQGDR